MDTNLEQFEAQYTSLPGPKSAPSEAEIAAVVEFREHKNRDTLCQGLGIENPKREWYKARNVIAKVVEAGH